MNGKKARKLKKIATANFETNENKSAKNVYRDLKQMYKNGLIKLHK
jgi:hypothetical protein